MIKNKFMFLDSLEAESNMHTICAGNAFWIATSFGCVAKLSAENIVHNR
jgi:hypothetical protein